ncbi:hypothetical protein SB761_33805, partial [Pseudomonas sp. SIMBA_064]
MREDPLIDASSPDRCPANVHRRPPRSVWPERTDRSESREDDLLLLTQYRFAAVRYPVKINTQVFDSMTTAKRYASV